jgi:phage regulator Rha-like protein
MSELTLLPTAGAASITSDQIAELVGRRHDNVKRTIEALVELDVIRLPQIEVSEKINNLGFLQKTEAYVFAGDDGKRDSIVVVARLSPQFTAKLVDRWQELEARLRAPALPDFTNPAIAARAWAEQFEQRTTLQAQNQQQAQQIEADRPKVAALERIAEEDGDMSMTEAAKHLRIPPKEFFRRLHAEGWIYRRVGGKGWCAYENRIQQHLLAHRFHAVHYADGHDQHIPQVMVTRRGITRLAQLLSAPTAVGAK